MAVVRPSMDTEEWIRCPYNNAHMVPYKRFAYHEKKCRQQMLGDTHELCPFNSQHVVEKHKYRHHVATCPDKGTIIESTVMQEGKPIEKVKEFTFESEECWEEEFGTHAPYIHPSQMKSGLFDDPEPIAPRPTRTSFRPVLQPPSGKPEVLSRVAPQTAVLQDLHKGRGKPSPATKLQQNPKPPGSQVPREPSSLAITPAGIGRGTTSNGFHKAQSTSALQQMSYSEAGMGMNGVGGIGGGVGHGHGQPPRVAEPPRTRPSVLGRGRVSASSSANSSADPSPAGSPSRPANPRPAPRASPGRGRGLRHAETAPGAISLSPSRPGGSSPGRGRGVSNANRSDHVGNVGNASGEPFRGIGRGVFFE